MAGWNGDTTVYISSAKWSAVTAWAANTAYTVGQLVRQLATPTVNSERVFMCLVAGTSHLTTEPTWVTTKGAKTTDNTVTWIEVTGLAAVNGDLTHTPNWTAGSKSVTVTQGHIIKDDAGTHLFIATTISGTGTGAAVEPTWSVGAVGNTTIENAGANQIVWTYIGTSFSNWAAPHKTIQTGTSSMATGAAGTTLVGTPTWFFVGHDHAESNAASCQIFVNYKGLDTAPFSVVCVNTAGSVPPVAADVRTTATVTTTSSLGIAVNGIIRICYGITFVCGTTSNPSFSTCTDGAAHKLYHSCNFQFGSNSGGTLDGGNDSSASVEYVNCTIKFVGTSTTWQPKGKVIWRDSTMFDAAGTYASIVVTTFERTHVTIKNCDLSGLGSGKQFFTGTPNVVYDGTLINCKLPASFTLAVAANLTAWLVRYRMINCDNGAGDYRSELYDFYGAVTTETTIVRTGGATNGTTKFAWKLVTTTKNSLYAPLQSFPIGRKNTVTGSNVTATLHGIINAAAVPNDDQLYMEVSYMGSATDPRGTTKTTQAATVFTTGAALTADTSAWDTVATARANTTAYTLGQTIKLASNPGRLFFCTTAGTSAGSEPVGYASAVDGGSVTDGTAVFRAGCRFKMSVTLTSPTPQQAGIVSALVKAALASTTYYIDPFLDLT